MRFVLLLSVEMICVDLQICLLVSKSIDLKKSRIMKNLLSLLLLTSAFTLKAQVGNLFPAMEAETLTAEMINLPEGLQGKYSILGLAFSQKAEDNLKTWFRPAYNQFIREPSKTNIFATDYDINMFFIPMFTGAKTVAYKKTMGKVQKTTDPKLHPYILFYKGTMKTYKTSLSFEGKTVPYFYLIDDTGKIIWQTSGAYSDQKMQEIIDRLDEALGEWE